MKVRLNKWGNSIGIRLPKKILTAARVTEGAELSISVENGRIILDLCKVLLNCPDCDTELKFTCTINGFYQYDCPECKSLIRVNKKRH